MKNKLIAMINDWLNFESATKEDYGEVTFDMARANYKEYEQQIKKEQQNYLKQLCEKIKTEAKLGKLSITTLYTQEEKFMTDDFLQELKTYFISRGFKVKEKDHVYSMLKKSLRISWEEDNNND
jgi:hypothetical protein